MKQRFDETNLQQQIDKLPREMTPGRDLWQGIELAIEQQPKSKRYATGYLAWAASCVLAVLIGWNLNKPINEVEPTASVVDVMEQSFIQNRQAMLVGFGQPNLAQLPQDIQLQFSQLQSARTSLEQAIKNDPENADLVNLLSWLYQQELSLIEQLYQPQWQSI